MTSMEPIRRHDARIVALSALFCWELTKDAPVDVFDRVARSFFTDDDACTGGTPEVSPSRDRRFGYASKLFLAGTENAGTIDPFISRSSLGWPLSRMPRVDLSIIRLAIAEAVCVKETPVEVVIDEALELAKEFSAHASPRFVNGILMGILREMGHAKTPR